MNRLTHGRKHDYFVVVRGSFNLIRSLGIPRVQFTVFKESFKNSLFDHSSMHVKQ